MTRRNASAVRTAPEAFIRAHTRLRPVPLVPELRLHVADEATELWSRTEEELGEMDLPAPFWAFAWAGGQALARYVLDHPQLVSGLRVADIGTGSGLVGLAAARAGAHVTAYDTDAFAVMAARLNAAANGLALDVRLADPLLDGPCPDCDVALVGDLFYEKPVAERLLPWLEEAARRGVGILIGDPGRSYLPAGLERLAEYGVPTTRALEDLELKRTGVWALRI